MGIQAMINGRTEKGGCDEVAFLQGGSIAGEIGEVVSMRFMPYKGLHVYYNLRRKGGEGQ